MSCVSLLKSFLHTCVLRTSYRVCVPHELLTVSNTLPCLIPYLLSNTLLLTNTVSNTLLLTVSIPYVELAILTCSIPN